MEEFKQKLEELITDTMLKAADDDADITDTISNMARILTEAAAEL